MFLNLLFLENFSLSMTPLGLRNLFTLAGFVLPRDSIHPMKKIRISHNGGFSLFFATLVVATTHELSVPANTRKELLH